MSTILRGPELAEAIDQCVVVQATAPPPRFLTEDELSTVERDKKFIVQQIEALPDGLDRFDYERKFAAILESCKSPDARTTGAWLVANFVVKH